VGSDDAERNPLTVETVTVAASQPEPLPGADLERGRTIGRYVVIEQLGRGGMGVVYRAYDPELDRSVAIKVLRAARTDQARARLLREAQALARLTHPNVVAVHDTGTFGDEVFIATELVDGTTLKAWLRDKPRTRREILAVLVAAGEGLDGAHRAGLVHRDFKPENVMIGKDGRARVLDFGLARAIGDTDPEGTPPADDDDPLTTTGGSRLDTPLTRAGAIMGTPRYMAPEQVAGGDIDARTDQYAFCVTAWEALAGEHPFGDTPEERRARAREGRLGATRGLLTRRLRAVLARGLSVSPRERWPSMATVLAELRRDPARRATIVAAVGLLAVAIVVTAVIVRRAGATEPPCRDARAQLDGVWDATRRDAVTAAFAQTRVPFAAEASRQAIGALDRWTDRWVDAHTDACTATAVRHEQSGELLDLRMACLAGRRRELAAIVEVLASADAEVVAHAVDVVGRLPELDACSDATALRAAFPRPTDSRELARLEGAEAELARAIALEGAGKYSDAAAPAQRSLAEARAVGHWPTIANALVFLARLHDQLGQAEPSAAAAREALGAAARSRVDALEAEAWITAIAEIGDVQARHDEIDPWLPFARAIVERANDPALVAELDETLAILNWRRGRYDDALADAARARAYYERTYGDDDRHVLRTLFVIANVKDERGQHAEALALYQHILDVDRAELGDRHPVVAQDWSNLATSMLSDDRDAEALAAFERALAIHEAAAPDSLLVSAVVTNIGTVHTRQGRHELAAAAYQRALAIVERSFGPEHPDVAHALLNLAETLVSQGKLAEAHAAMARCLAIWTKAYGPDHPYLAYAQLQMARVLLAEGAAAEARTRATRALAIAETQLGAEHEIVAECRMTLGQTSVALGRRAEGVAELRRALALAEKIHGPSSHDLVGILVALGRAQSDGRATLERAVALADNRDEIAAASFALAEALWSDPASRARARTLAEQARDAVSAPGTGPTAIGARIDRWLGSRAR
jgi:tetratricopeptide (TPR) repeat protein/predicted Ser/Thr protein kinase